MTFQTGDYVKHPLFGNGVYIEGYMSQCIVFFEKFGNKKTKHDLIKKVETTTKDYKEDYYNEIHEDDLLVTNDML